jgi:carboxymethylenebutenolidase
MRDFVSLTAADGHGLRAWLSEPSQKPKGAIVVLQEIFGVNSHIRDVTDRFAAEGYQAIAPALFDRFAPGFECGYGADDMATAIALMGKIQIDQTLLDIDAAIAKVRPAGKVGVVGFCFGGLMTWLSACRLRPDAAVAYYGGRIEQFKDEQPSCPIMLHFGSKDSHIPPAAVAAVRAAHSALPIYLYDADHGFACDQRGSYDAASHKLAWRRTLDFFATHLAA